MHATELPMQIILFSLLLTILLFYLQLTVLWPIETKLVLVKIIMEVKFYKEEN